jgi:hypothetical protein
MSKSFVLSKNVLCTFFSSGTMKVRQVTWCKSTRNILYFNTLSCFECYGKCAHYSLTQINYNGKEETSSPISDVVPEPSTSAFTQINTGNKAALSPISDVVPEPSQFLKEGQWVVVRYSMVQMKGERRWVGQIKRVNENDTYLVSFVKPVRSKFHSGFLYTFVESEGEDTVCQTQIMYAVQEPEKFQRKLKFAIHCDKL